MPSSDQDHSTRKPTSPPLHPTAERDTSIRRFHRPSVRSKPSPPISSSYAAVSRGLPETSRCWSDLRPVAKASTTAASNVPTNSDPPTNVRKKKKGSRYNSRVRPPVPARQGRHRNSQIRPQTRNHPHIPCPSKHQLSPPTLYLQRPGCTPTSGSDQSSAQSRHCSGSP